MNNWLIKVKKKKINKRYIVDFFKKTKIYSAEYLQIIISSEVYSGEITKMCKYCDQKKIDIYKLVHQAFVEKLGEQWKKERSRQIEELKNCNSL